MGTKTQSFPRSHYLEDHPPGTHSKRHSLGTLPEAGKFESIPGLTALSVTSWTLSSDSGGVFPKSAAEIITKYDENSNERTVEVDQLSDSSLGSPKNRTLADVSNQPQESDSSTAEDTRSPAERSLAKLFGKRKSLNREKAVVDSSEYYIAESASSLTPKSNVTVET